MGSSPNITISPRPQKVKKIRGKTSKSSIQWNDENKKIGKRNKKGVRVRSKQMESGCINARGFMLITNMQGRGGSGRLHKGCPENV